MAKNREKKIIPVDENGNPVETPKKKIDWKKGLKTCAVVAGSIVVGIVGFCLVGVAMAANVDGDSSGTIDIGGDTDSCTFDGEADSASEPVGNDLA